MTFERAYGLWLVRELNAMTVEVLGKRCKHYDEVAFKPLRKDPEEIAVVINGGGAARSGVQGQDQNNLSLNVIVVCKNGYGETVRSLIDTLQEKYNALPKQLMYTSDSGKEITQNVKSVFFTPITIDENDYPTEKGTIKAVWLSFNVSVSYGMTAVISPPVLKLKIGEGEYNIDYLIQYDATAQPSYDTYLAQGDKHSKQNAVSVTNAWALSIAKVQEDDLQTILQNEVDAKEGGLFGKRIVLCKDGGEIEIRGYQLTESYVDNVAVYVLTLTC